MSDVSAQDCRWLDAATRLARPYLGTTAENPTVGAIVVDEQLQLVFGRAVTARGGRPHAETQALAEARGSARGRTLYVTLEPCNHWGRTPPCADAVIQAGIGRVVVGLLDPDPRTAGNGIKRLRQAGIVVALADHRPSRLLHEAHIMRKTRGRPFITAKLAVSKDGMIGLPDKANVPITGEEARRWTHMERAMSDAVMVGARTAQIDDPQLTVRLKGLEHRTHMRIILAGATSFDTSLNLIDGVSGYPTMIITEQGHGFDVPPEVQVIEVEGKNGRPNLRKAMAALSDKGVGRLMVEGGAKLIESLIAAELVDRFHLLKSEAMIGRKGVPATMLGSMEGRLRAAGFAEVDRRALGADIVCTFEREL
ncbi:MAG: bifunctional diaminohydroxyphosphoribosylaminopyrimidine deaminase/5-amino-6-(5-phosphoribosylamino)uracil reductase RibD [Devosia sp.]|nr:bifunctional diaminohydroxyphosphoribosylaminopyrimidine deaminase/5-amino-6-(5-phosphoribosylamino)uracil reductase RibD [Devosia sp.]